LKKINIAIDGYSACGKSTLAKQLANKLGYVYIDTGAMYRSVALFSIEQNLISKNTFKTELLISRLGEINIHFEVDDKGSNTTFLNGVNVEEKIRSMQVSSFVSPVATIKEVREKLVDLQQKMGVNGGVVMDGRDIGSVVLPNAELKLFMTASDDIRTQRRLDEILANGKVESFESVKENLKTRDHIDSTRAESPLTQVNDAVVVDNSFLTREEQLAKVLTLVESKLQ
jgi:cytidylate kinase